jgi:hypothetical protein
MHDTPLPHTLNWQASFIPSHSYCKISKLLLDAFLPAGSMNVFNLVTCYTLVISLRGRYIRSVGGDLVAAVMAFGSTVIYWIHFRCDSCNPQGTNPFSVKATSQKDLMHDD